MKSYEEMTEAVLLRGKKERAALKKKHLTVVSAVVCLCLVATAVFAGMGAGTQAGNHDREPRLSVFTITASAEQQRQPMLKGERVPCYAVLRVHNIKGLQNKDLLEIRTNDREYAENIMGEYRGSAPNGPDWSTVIWSSENIMVSCMYSGSFWLTVDDYNQIQDVSIKTTEFGSAVMHGADFYDALKADGVGITWTPSQMWLEILEKDPERKLSGITDTISVSVEFKSGETEVLYIDISVDDDGRIFGTYRDVVVG